MSIIEQFTEEFAWDNTTSDAKKILDIITAYGGIDGDHHKQWVFDSIVRVLTGTQASYDKWIEEYQWPGGKPDEDDPEPEYTWDEGCPP